MTRQVYPYSGFGSPPRTGVRALPTGRLLSLQARYRAALATGAVPGGYALAVLDDIAGELARREGVAA